MILKGHEQEGSRPAIVVGVPKGAIRYPVVIVIPLTTQSGPWAIKNPNLYHYIPQGTAGIPRDSIALIDQLRTVDVQRVRAYLGSLEKEIYERIRKSLLKIFSG
ncbi:type II toxin-antitoxin system PemK/MazF family toxin [Desulfocucumis palustris]|uniref:type II toxin-antitoxin system PemK/MazF family toxin n=1 Tax=Desulfocucumis palustris TaxID=1898651 RepID=UPI0027D79A81|nr:type II toxin-antitoxin system PemK/MazF family toxin [Desulfocucumis palustris]